MRVKRASRAVPVATVFAVLALGLSVTPMPSHAASGGQSNSHISAQGRANSNGPNSADRDFGRDRASDRAHMHGKSQLAHSRNK